LLEVKLNSQTNKGFALGANAILPQMPGPYGTEISDQHRSIYFTSVLQGIRLIIQLKVCY